MKRIIALLGVVGLLTGCEGPTAPLSPPMEFWEVEEKPVLICRGIPEYPEIARQAGIEGDVFLEMIVGIDGHVDSIRILRGPSVFHEAAREAAMRMHFRPARHNGHPVRVRVSERMSFRL